MSSHSEWLDAVAGQDIESLLESLGYHVKGSGSRFSVCPLPTHQHHENSPSFSIFWGGRGGKQRQMWKCHGACGGLYGDIIDLAGFLWIPGYEKRDFNMRIRAAEALSGKHLPVSLPAASLPVPMLPNWTWKLFLPIGERARQYILDRGVRDWQIEAHRLGSAHRLENLMVVKDGVDRLLSIPTFHGEELMGVKLRLIDGKDKYRYFTYPGSRRGLFNYNRVAYKQGPILVVKGEIAAMVLEEEFGEVCAPTSGEAGSVESIRDTLAFGKNIVVGDNNNAQVILAAKRRAAALGGHLRFPPTPWNGVDDWYLGDPAAREVIQGWLDEGKRE